MKTIKLLALTVIALAACGDNKSRPDAAMRRDGPPADAYCSNCPAPPAIGTTQIDRMGRPAINTALNYAFTDMTPTTATGNTKKDAYNADKDKATWRTTYVGEIALNLGILDVLDGGVCGNGICELGEANVAGAGNLACALDCPTAAQVGTANQGCGNQAAFSGTGTTNLMAYGTLAGILADDRLYVDTSKTMCQFYFAVEFGALSPTGNSTCGGRAPQYDVIDFTYSAIAGGFKGFDLATFTPKYGDGVTAHTDLLTTFPFLGAPH
jgi:hypothetical protein